MYIDFSSGSELVSSVLFIVVAQVQGGGNAGNALTGAARLGLMPRLITKVSHIIVIFFFSNIHLSLN